MNNDALDELKTEKIAELEARVRTLEAALAAEHLELNALAGSEKCDHDVNLCWCGVKRALEMGAKALGSTAQISTHEAKGRK